MKRIVFLFALFCTIQLAAQRETISLNGTWQFDRTEKAFPPEKFSREIPVPGLIHLAEPKIDDYRIWFKKPDATEEKQAHGVYDIDYVPKYNWYRKTIQLDKKLEGKDVLLRIKKTQ